MQDRKKIPRCAQCREPLKTIPGRTTLSHLPILCKECFGLASYERKGRSWLELMYLPVVTGEAEEIPG